MASDASLAGGEVYPQLYLPYQGSKMMLTEDKANNNKAWHYYATMAVVWLVVLLVLPQLDIPAYDRDALTFKILVLFVALQFLGYTGKLEVDATGLTYTKSLCRTRKYSWSELSIEFTTTERRTHDLCPLCTCCGCGCDCCVSDRDPTTGTGGDGDPILGQGVAILITSAGGQRVATLTFGSHIWHGRHGQTLAQVAARFNELKAGAGAGDPESGWVPPEMEREG